MHGGKLAILTMVLLAAALGALACWVHYTRGRQMMEFWSVDGANLIRHADRVELLLLEPVQNAAEPMSNGPAPNGPALNGIDNTGPAKDATVGGDGQLQRLEIQGRSYLVRHVLDISRQPGLVHARHALIVDGNFEEPEPSSLSERPFSFAARFSDDSRQVTVAFQPRTRHVVYVETGDAQRLVPHISDGWKLRSQTWGNDRLPKPASPDAESPPANPSLQPEPTAAGP